LKWLDISQGCYPYFHIDVPFLLSFVNDVDANFDSIESLGKHWNLCDCANSNVRVQVRATKTLSRRAFWSGQSGSFGFSEIVINLQYMNSSEKKYFYAIPMNFFLPMKWTYEKTLETDYHDFVLEPAFRYAPWVMSFSFIIKPLLLPWHGSMRNVSNCDSVKLKFSG